MPRFTSERSLRVRGELHRDLVEVVDSAIVQVDFSLTDGMRDAHTQKRLFVDGASELDGVIRRSKHQVDDRFELSRAFDFVPLPFTNWDDRPLFTAYAYFFIGIGWEKGIELTWGGDWDNDFQWRDQSFHDLPHIELRGEKWR